LGSVRPEEQGDLPPEDEGLGSVRPEEQGDLPPDDEGLGSVRTDDATRHELSLDAASSSGFVSRL
jgi:hypothetical protein